MAKAYPQPGREKVCNIRTMRIWKAGLVAVVAAAVSIAHVSAVTRVSSSDGQFWDIQDTSPWSQDSGGIATGGRSNPFNGFGYLKMQVRGSRDLLADNVYVRGFGLHHDGHGRFDSITPVVVEGVLVWRSITTWPDTSYLRYLDAFVNTANEVRTVKVAWGGAVVAYADGGKAAVAVTADGDRLIEPGDSFVTMMQNATDTKDPRAGPSGHGPSAHVTGTGLPIATGNMYGNPFTEKWPGFDPAHIGYVFTLRLPAGGTASLMTFVVKGRSETYDPRGGYPIPFKDALITGQAPYAGADANIPKAGSEIAAVTEQARHLVAQPDTRGLTALELSRVVNWHKDNLHWPPADPAAAIVFEKDVTALQAAMTSAVTSADIIRAYLARIALYDKRGPTFRSILSLNPRAIADARDRDADRAAGRVRGPFHGVPIGLKDNIDAEGLPTRCNSQSRANAPNAGADAEIVAAMPDLNSVYGFG